jgi:hypothetical protein
LERGLNIAGAGEKKLVQRQFDVGLISPFGPREARPKRRKIVPRAPRAERFFAPVEFTLRSKFFHQQRPYKFCRPAH